jgi:putative transposase
MVYYRLSGESTENLDFMEMMDRLHITDPSAGSRRMYKYLRRLTGKKIGRKRVCRLMRLMGIEAVYPRKRTTIPGGPSGISPYRLKGLDINRPDQVLCADITYIPMRRGFMYLFAIMDWYSRKIIDWELSNTLDSVFCLRCLKRALQTEDVPEIFNTDQGCQFTSEEWIKCLKDANITISMDGKGRWLDNVVIERFWRSIKYEDIYLKSYESPLELEKGIRDYIYRYNTCRPHQSLSDATPEEVYSQKVVLVAGK